METEYIFTCYGTFLQFKYIRTIKLGLETYKTNIAFTTFVGSLAIQVKNLTLNSILLSLPHYENKLTKNIRPTDI